MDKRSLKTKRKIKEAFIDLLTYESYDNITIQDISDVADITRKTFYYYYDGLYELVMDMKEELSKAVKNVLEEISPHDLHAPRVLFEKVANILFGELYIYGKLLVNKSNHDFIINFNS